MLKTLTAGLVATTIALTSLAPTSAQANDHEDLAKLLAGIAAIAIISRAVRDDDRSRTRTHTQTHRHAGIPPNRRVLPFECFRRVDTRNGRIGVFGKRCLNNNYRFADRLPQRCLVHVPIRDRFRPAYRAQCLRNAGFTARH